MKMKTKIEKKIEKKVKQRMEKNGKLHVGTEDSTLKRTIGDAAQEKFRITFEARHIVGNYFGEGDPWEKNWRGALVVKGTHARLSNISNEGCWSEDEVQGRQFIDMHRNLQAESCTAMCS